MYSIAKTNPVKIYVIKPLYNSQNASDKYTDQRAIEKLKNRKQHQTYVKFLVYIFEISGNSFPSIIRAAF